MNVVKPSLAAILAALATLGHANLLLNGNFESVPNNSTGQGLLPLSWYQAGGLNPGADTYSNDGSYGLPPSFADQFTGVVAHEGNRWIAGWSRFGAESVGQTLQSPLASGSRFRLSAWLHTSQIHNRAGGYSVHLSQAGGANSMQVGSLYTEATFSESWQFVELTFDAPTNSALLTEIILTPYTTGSNMSDPDSTYAGLDSLNLGAVPEPTSFVAVGAGFAALVRWGKRKGGSRS